MHDHDEFRFDKLLALAAWNAVVLSGSAIYMGGAVWRATAMGVVVFGASLTNYGRGTLSRAAMVITFFVLAVWTGAIPSPDEWAPLLHSHVALLRQP